MADATNTGDILGAALGIIVWIGIIYALKRTFEKGGWLEAKRTEIATRLASEEASIIERIDEIESKIRSELLEKKLLLSNAKIAETRTRDGRQNLVIIDSGGSVYVDRKGVHYIGSVRRLSWDWSKILVVQHSNQRASKQNVILPVSNRQRMSGFQFVGTDTLRNHLVSFLSRLTKEPPTVRTSPIKKTPSKKQSASVIHITQNISDSVIQGDVIGIEEHP